MDPLVGWVFSQFLSIITILELHTVHTYFFQHKKKKKIFTLLYSENYSNTQIGGKPLRGFIKYVTTSEVIILCVNICLEIPFLCFPMVTGRARLQIAAATSILPGGAEALSEDTLHN